MKKNRSLFSKIYDVVIIIIAFLIILFWREIYQGILYADICLKYMAWQDHVNEIGNYKISVRGGEFRTKYYCNKEKTVIEDYHYNSRTSSKRALYNESDIPNTQLYYIYNEEYKNIENVALKIYYYDDFEHPIRPYATPIIPFEKNSFWELFKTGKDLIYIRIIDMNEEKFYELYSEYGERILINIDTGLIETLNNESYDFKIGNTTEEELAFPEGCNIILADYEEADRNKGKTSVKISNCEAEAGTIVSYDFEFENVNENTLYGFAGTDYENIKIAKIMNHITYKKFQETFTNLRDLTEEDFDNYFVMLVINTDIKKQISFKDLTTELTNKKIELKEENIESNVYHGNLIIIPNSEDVEGSGATILRYGVSIE